MIKNIKERINRRAIISAFKIIAIAIFGGYLALILSQLEKNMVRMENIFRTELEQVYLLLEEEHQDIKNLNEQTQSTASHHKEVLQSLFQLKSMQESLSQMIDQQFVPLDEKLKALIQNPVESGQDQDSATSKHHFLPAQGYRIFGVQSYGVIVSTPEGNFVIARVGQKIGELGVVKMIAAHKIIVGQSIITDGTVVPQ